MLILSKPMSFRLFWVSNDWVYQYCFDVGSDTVLILIIKFGYDECQK
jgi:hypothetical protein